MPNKIAEILRKTLVLWKLVLGRSPKIYFSILKKTNTKGYKDLIYLILNLFGRFMSLIQLVQEDNNLHYSYNYYRGNKRVGTYYSKCIKKEKCVGTNEVVHLMETFMDSSTIHGNGCWSMKNIEIACLKILQLFLDYGTYRVSYLAI